MDESEDEFVSPFFEHYLIPSITIGVIIDWPKASSTVVNLFRIPNDNPEPCLRAIKRVIRTVAKLFS